MQQEWGLKTKRIRHGLMILATLLTFPVCASTIVIEYDKDEQLLGVTADKASLIEILKQISVKTGITIRIDPAVEKTVSFQLPPQPLQKALQKVCKGLSYVIEYSTISPQRSVISGIELLPEGKQDSGQLVPVTVVNARASHSRGGGSYREYDTPPEKRHYSGNRYPKAIRKPRLPVDHQQNLSPNDLAGQGMDAIPVTPQKEQSERQDRKFPTMRDTGEALDRQ